MKFKLNKYIIDDILNSEHPSDFETTKEYAVLILRLPYIKESKVKVISYPFLIKDGKVYEYSREAREFIPLGDFKDLHNFLDIRIDKILAKISKLQATIEKMEDRLYENDIDSDFPNEWLMLKKSWPLSSA